MKVKRVIVDKKPYNCLNCDLSRQYVDANWACSVTRRHIVTANPIPDWCPLEDALDQRIDELQAKYDKKCEDYLDILKKNTALANDYAEEVSENVRLESENKALRLIAGSHSMSELRRNRIMAGWRRGDTLKNEVKHE